jgi:hypothetical protein
VAGSLLREPTCMCGVTPETLWAGPDLKSVYAFFHFSKMQPALEPERDGNYAAQEAMGTIVDSGWQRSFGPYFDAFLSAARASRTSLSAALERISRCLGELKRCRPTSRTDATGSAKNSLIRVRRLPFSH